MSELEAEPNVEEERPTVCREGRLQMDGRGGVVAAMRMGGQREVLSSMSPRGIKTTWPFYCGGGGGPVNPEGSQEVTDQHWIPAPATRRE